MKKLIKMAKYLIEMNKVEKIGNGGAMGQIYSVEGNTVRIFSKPGRKLTSCTCDNFTRFCNQPRICHHIISAILFESHESFYKKIDSLIEFYKGSSEINNKLDIGVAINDLKDLRRIK